MDWNIPVAIVAVLGFIFSVIFGILSLNQSKKLNSMAVNAQLFDKRIEVIEFFDSLIQDDFLNMPKGITIHMIALYDSKMDTLFNKTDNMSMAISDLALYFRTNNVEYLKRNIPKDTDDDLINIEFGIFYRTCLDELKTELGITNLDRE